MREPLSWALADVLVVGPGGRPPAERCAEILGRFPGASLVLVLGGCGDITAGFRDGSVVTIREPLAEGHRTRRPVRLEEGEGPA
jgi:hypothetical protein